MSVHRLRRVRVNKVAVVKNPANGNRFHLLKSAPELGCMGAASALAAIGDHIERQATEDAERERLLGAWAAMSGGRP